MNTIFQRRLRSAACFSSVLLLAACATTPPAPTASLQDARRAIATAEQAEAGRYAPEDLSDARSNLELANAAVSGERMITAQRLAEESKADADLATAKTADVKAHAVNDDMRHSTATLIEEMQHSSGDSQ
jgi:hypothetical protein